MNLVYIYDAISRERPAPRFLTPSNLIIGPSVVNNLGWVRGYWEIVASEPLRPEDIRSTHLFISPRRGVPSAGADTVDEEGRVLVHPPEEAHPLKVAGHGNFNLIDFRVRGILEKRGLIETEAQEFSAL